MNECEIRGCEETALVTACNYCAGSFCPDHQLPERHSCPQIKVANTLGPDFRASGESVQIDSEIGDDTTDGEQAKKECAGESCSAFIVPNKEFCPACRINRRHRSDTVHESAGRDRSPSTSRTKESKKVCASSGCSTIVAPSKEYCRSCRHKPSVPNEYQSPEVKLKNNTDPKTEETNSSPLLISLKIRLETIGIRTRGWIMTIIQLASIGVFLLGLWAFYTLFTSPAYQLFGGEYPLYEVLTLPEPIEFLGWDVPAIDNSWVTWTPMETLFVLSIVLTFGGLALSFKLIFGTTTPGVR